jgi:tetratricopeptide (TPR) repeat protein
MLVGCGIAATVGLALIVFGGVLWQMQAAEAQRLADEAQAKKAAEAFGPAVEQLKPPKEPVDIDKTIRVIHEIDFALKSYEDFESYLDHIGKQDYRGVDPDVLDARRELLEQVRTLYARQTEAEQQEALWDFTKGLILESLSVVEAEGEWGTLGPTGSFHVDREQAKELLNDFREQQRVRERQIRDIGQARDALFEAMVRYSEVYYEHMEAWDRLCVLRDRAYLASLEGDWPTVEVSARAAIAMAPQEREAHLLLARALLAQGNPEDQQEAAEVLQDLMNGHPGTSAPTLVLMGELARQRGDAEAARLNFQQAAAYYPRQAQALTDMLDPYKQRDYLRKSREGTLILEAYQDTMRGAGWYSPELQLARTAFDAGDFPEGKRRVLDHFARRRAQHQWDFVLSDLAYAQDLLGEEVRQIFPEEAWLDLQISRPMFSSGVQVAVRNRTDRTLRNATLILLVQFTDMHPGDYHTFAPPTQPALPPHQTTDYGTLDIATRVHGQDRTADDVVRHRAILISDEAVSWVDTDEFRIELVEQAAQARRAERPIEEGSASWTRQLDTLARRLPEEAIMQIEPTLGRDTVVFELPRELAVLQPVFRLTYGGTTYTAAENRIDDDHITLKFNAVEDFTKAEAGNVQLGIQTIFGEVVLDYAKTGEMAYRFNRLGR